MAYPCSWQLADSLEQQGVSDIEHLERVHILSWLHALSTQPGAKGRLLAARSVNCYARSMRAFCNWLEAEGYVQVLSRSPRQDAQSR